VDGCVYSLGGADIVLAGEAADDHAGWPVVSPGDVDGDGFDDLIVGAYGESSVASYSGAAYLVTGPITGSASLSSATAKWTGAAREDSAGYGLSGGCDLTGDGIVDLLIGAPWEDTVGDESGAVYVVDGSLTGTRSLSAATGRLLGEEADDYVGLEVAVVGDTNGDGACEALVGAPWSGPSESNNVGAAYLVRGPISGTQNLSGADAIMEGVFDDDYAGIGVADAGDLNGDGLSDVVVGASSDNTLVNNEGSAFVVLGPMTGTFGLDSADGKHYGEAAYDSAGESVGGAGDVDGDGLDDLIVGAPTEDSAGSYSGAAYVVLGPATGTVALAKAQAKLVGESGEDRAGSAVCGAGDVNGDGFHDVVVGAPFEDEGASNAGATYLLLGPLSSTTSLGASSMKLNGTSTDDSGGYSVSSSGDWDSDGLRDIAAASYLSDTAGTNSGDAYIIFGSSL